MYLKTLPNGITIHDVVLWIDGPGASGNEFRDVLTKLAHTTAGSWTGGVNVAGGREFIAAGAELISLERIVGIPIKTMLIWYKTAAFTNAFIEFELTAVYTHSDSAGEITTSGATATHYIDGQLATQINRGRWQLLAVTCEDGMTNIDGSIGYADNIGSYTGSYGPIILSNKLWTADQIRQYYNATTPYGNTSEFYPTQLSGLRLWLDGADTTSITSSNNLVSQWNDKSGCGNHAVQGTAARRPITGAATINGRNVISFDGPTNDQFLNILNMSCSPNTVAVVYKTSETTFADWNGTITSRVAPNSNKVAASSANSGMTGIASGTGITDTSQSGLNVYLDGTSYSYAQFADYGTGGLSSLPMTSPHFVMWTDDLSSGTQNWVIGADTFGAVGLRHWNGQICEIVILDHAVSDDERTKLTAYLKTKWGIA